MRISYISNQQQESFTFHIQRCRAWKLNLAKFKLETRHTFLTVRVINHWNCLPWNMLWHLELLNQVWMSIKRRCLLQLQDTELGVETIGLVMQKVRLDGPKGFSGWEIRSETQSSVKQFAQILVMHTIYEFTFVENIKHLKLAFCGCTSHTGIYNVYNRMCTSRREHGFKCNQSKIPIKCEPCVCTFLLTVWGFFNQIFLIAWKWRTVF